MEKGVFDLEVPGVNTRNRCESMEPMMEPYSPRPIRFLELWEVGGWKLKAYGIAYVKSAPGTALIGAAREAAETCLRQRADETNHYGVGFVGIHEGKTANFVFVDWWADENELHHHVYVSSGEAPARLEDVTGSGLAACVWDLRVIGFERDAWVSAILKNHHAPDLAGYLAERLNEDV